MNNQLKKFVNKTNTQSWTIPHCILITSLFNPQAKPMLVLGLTSSDLMNGEGGSTHTLYFFFFFQFKGSKIPNPWRSNLTVYKSHSQWFPCPSAHLHTRQKKYLTLMHNRTVSHQCNWIHVNPIIWIVMLLCLCFVSRVFISEVFRDRSHQRTVYLRVNAHDIQI